MAAPRWWCALAVVGLVLTGACGSSGDDGDDDSDGHDDTADAAATAECVTPPANPFLADSAMPIAHIDSAQSNGTPVAGPSAPGPTATLTDDQLDYTHLGPGHFGVAFSPPYPDGSRVIWSPGGDRISKLDAADLSVLAELPLPGHELQTPDEADTDIATLDRQSGDELATTALELAAKYLTGLSGVYYLLDRDNTLFVAGADSVLAYHDAEPGDPASPIALRDEWDRPAEVTGAFVGINMTFDGKLVLVTDEGWIVVVDRDFGDFVAAPLAGADGAAAHNQSIVDQGMRLGQGSFVRNSIAVDDGGGIYAASFDHLQKLVWTGERLSTDPADGAWSEPYLDGTGLGTGATPALMGYCDDRFVVITDGAALMNVTLFWRDEVPDGWQPPDGAPSRRIAGLAPADMGDPDLAAIQTEQGVVVAGYGALVVNNEPPTVPAGFPAIGARVLVAYAGADPAYTPHGLQKFVWDPDHDRFAEAWVNTEVSSTNAVPVASLGSDTVYTVGVRDGQWALEALDWTTGASRFTWITGSYRYNTNFSGLNVDGDGAVVHTTTFGIVRYAP